MSVNSLAASYFYMIEAMVEMREYNGPQKLDQ